MASQIPVEGNQKLASQYSFALQILNIDISNSWKRFCVVLLMSTICYHRGWLDLNTDVIICHLPIIRTLLCESWSNPSDVAYAAWNSTGSCRNLAKWSTRGLKELVQTLALLNDSDGRLWRQGWWGHFSLKLMCHWWRDQVS